MGRLSISDVRKYITLTCEDEQFGVRAHPCGACGKRLIVSTVGTSVQNCSDCTQAKLYQYHPRPDDNKFLVTILQEHVEMFQVDGFDEVNVAVCRVCNKIVFTAGAVSKGFKGCTGQCQRCLKGYCGMHVNLNVCIACCDLICTECIPHDEGEDLICDHCDDDVF